MAYDACRREACGCHDVPRHKASVALGHAWKLAACVAVWQLDMVSLFQLLHVHVREYRNLWFLTTKDVPMLQCILIRSNDPGD